MRSKPPYRLAWKSPFVAVISTGAPIAFSEMFARISRRPEGFEVGTADWQTTNREFPTYEEAKQYIEALFALTY